MPQFAPMSAPPHSHDAHSTQAASGNAAPTSGLLPQLYQHVIGPLQAEYYQRHFLRFETLGHPSPSWNGAAACCTLGWGLLRGLWRPTAIYAALVLVALAVWLLGLHGRIPMHMETSLVLLGTLLAGAVPGFLGNGWYYRQVHHQTMSALEQAPTLAKAQSLLEAQAPGRRHRQLAAAGQVTWWLLLAGLIWAGLAPASPPAEPTAARVGPPVLHFPNTPNTPPDTSATDGTATNEAPAATEAAPPAAVTVPSLNVAAPSTEATSPTTIDAASVAAAALPAAAGAAISAAPAPAPQPVAAAAAAAPTPASTQAAPPPAKAASRKEAAAPREAARKEAAKPAAGATARKKEPARKGATQPAAGKNPATRSSNRVAGTPTNTTAKAAQKNTPPSTQRYYVNVGTYANADNAARVEASIRAARLPVVKHTSTTNKGELVRLRAGPFATQAEAQAAQRTLQARKLPATLQPIR